MHKKKYTTITLLLLLLCCITNSQAVTGFDVITMKNGDIHNGTAARERFSIKTDYGLISVPYMAMLKLHVGQEKQKDRIITRSGEHFSGKLVDQEITALRQQNPTLPLNINDIAEIDFVSKPKTKPVLVPPDAIESSNGDRFFAWINTREFLLQHESGLIMMNRKDILVMHLEQDTENQQTLAQLTTTTGSSNKGKIISDMVSVKTGYGQTMQIPLSMVNTIAFSATSSESDLQFYFHKGIDTERLVRDRMVDGVPAPTMVRIPTGKYMRGDLQGDGDSDEQPPVPMHIKSFAIGLYEVTFEEYELFCKDTGRDIPDDEDWGRGRRPVINVSWEDAVAYTRWLSRKTGKNYRLPSDAEWEYAARAGTSTRYWWGQELKPTRANCEGCNSIWDGEKSSLVGRFPPNNFGLHDTAGNVFEWVADCLHEDFSSDPGDGTAVDRPNCGKRIIRGGAWSFPPKEIRSANRWRDFPTRISDDTGFRIARDIEE